MFHTRSKLTFTDSGAAIFKELGLATMALPKNWSQALRNIPYHAVYALNVRPTVMLFTTAARMSPLTRTECQSPILVTEPRNTILLPMPPLLRGFLSDWEFLSVYVYFFFLSVFAWGPYMEVPLGGSTSWRIPAPAVQFSACKALFPYPIWAGSFQSRGNS